jgi:uncharacterized membrane protein YraQ (UPF0718 family)
VLSAAIVIWALALLFGAVAYARPGAAHRTGLRLALDQFVTVMPRVIMAVVTATFLGALMPENMIASWLGAETGIAGILVAAVAGGLVPGGPVLSYPLAVVLMQTSAVRLLASLALPLAAGLLAGLLVTATGLKKAPTPPDSIRAARLAVMDLRDADPSITRDRRVDGRQR